MWARAAGRLRRAKGARCGVRVLLPLQVSSGGDVRPHPGGVGASGGTRAAPQPSPMGTLAAAATPSTATEATAMEARFLTTPLVKEFIRNMHEECETPAQRGIVAEWAAALWRLRREPLVESSSHRAMAQAAVSSYLNAYDKEVVAAGLSGLVFSLPNNPLKVCASQGAGGAKECEG